MIELAVLIVYYDNKLIRTVRNLLNLEVFVHRLNMQCLLQVENGKNFSIGNSLNGISLEFNISTVFYL